MRSIAALLCLLIVSFATTGARAQTARERAVAAYLAGKESFESGDKEQALVEFQLAKELSPSPEVDFMIAQSQYHLGRLKQARANYEQYLRQRDDGSALSADVKRNVEISKIRIQAIDRRPSVLSLSSVPAGADVLIEGEGETIRGQAPGTFELRRGRHRVTVSKRNYVSQTHEVPLDIAETKPYLVQLQPAPAMLEIRTNPPNATLYVRGARARNPYIQQVEAGSFEIYAEATDYRARSEVVVVGAGQRRVVDFQLPYVQRSGRPELIGFWTVAGAVGGAGLVLARGDNPRQLGLSPVPVTIVGAGALAGGVAGALMSTAFLPDYLPDNRALFRISAGLIGAAEGATVGAGITADWPGGWIGGALGLAAGTMLGTAIDEQAPNYGRVAVIQSAAAVGAITGALAMPAFDLLPDLPPEGDPNRSKVENRRVRLVSWGVLGGLNVGLGTGLALAYLPDQSAYGPTWQRVVLIDLAAAAGGFFAALSSTISECVKDYGVLDERCKFRADVDTARWSLVGAGVGLVGGWLLTSNYDKGNDRPIERRNVSWLPTLVGLPTRGADGRQQLVPALGAAGLF